MTGQPENHVKIITDDRVQQLLSETRAVDVLEQAFRDFSDQVITMGDRGFLKVGEHQDPCIFLPASHKKEEFFSIKYAASFALGGEKEIPTVQSVIWLFSAKTGEVFAMIHAGFLTAVKTGAASAVAARHLSNPNARILTIIGAGEQAKYQISCIARVRDLTEIRLVDLDPEKSRNLKAWVLTRLEKPVSVQIHSSADTAVPDADIIVTCTTSNRPVLDGRQLKSGSHVNAIGSFTPEMQEIDIHTIQRAHSIVTDSIAETKKYAGDLILPMQQGIVPKNIQMVELGDVITGKSRGRTDAGQITLYESIGFSPLDLALAIEVYRRHSPI